MALIGNGSTAKGDTAATTDIDSESFTIEMWLKALADPPDSYGGGILSKWQTTNWRDAAWCIFNHSQKRFWCEQSTPGNYGAAASEVGDFVNNTWIHYGWWHGAAGENKVYKNANKVWDAPVLTIPDKNWLIGILYSSLAGGDGDGSTNYRYFNGKITELRMWSGERTQAQIQRYMKERIAANASGLVHYWPLNESAGATATDKVAGLNFTLSGGYSWDSDSFPRRGAGAIL